MQLTPAQVTQRVCTYLESIGPTLDERARKLGCCSGYLGQLVRGQYPWPNWLLMEVGIQKKKIVVYEDRHAQ